MLGKFTGLLNLIFTPITILQPPLAIAILALITTVSIVGINRLTIKREIIRNLKKQMVEIKENLTKAQKEGDKFAIEKYITELVKLNKEFMKYSLKGMFVALLIATLFLPWIKTTYSGAVALLPFSIPGIGSKLDAIYWYALVSLTVGWIMTKIFGGSV